MNRSLRRTTLRAATVAAVGAATVLVTAAPAFAHVTAQPGEAAQGGYTVVTFRVPDESDTAGTVELEVRLPADHPITSVRTTPIPGWTAAITRATLDPPVQVDGNAVTEAVSTVTWTAAAGTRIGPGEYLDFPLSLGTPPAQPAPVAGPGAAPGAVMTRRHGDVEPIRPSDRVPAVSGSPSTRRPPVAGRRHRYALAAIRGGGRWR